MPDVRVLRPFANGHHENIVHPPEVITVTEDRARDLTDGGLVELITTATKVAPVHQNKMAVPPLNKATVAAQPKRRGRPPKAR